MGQLRWMAAFDGRYHLDLLLTNRKVQFMVDLGFVDPAQEVGLEIEPILYDSLKNAGLSVNHKKRTWRDASGTKHQAESGMIQAQLLDLSTGTGVGPIVHLFVTRGYPGVPNRVGVVFFHLLKGCSVTWDVENRIWSVQFP
jgi:hypothetical protein